jgi:type IV pilus assembly protein PilA
MDSTNPQSPDQPSAAGRVISARSRNASWVVLCGAMVVPVAVAGIIALVPVVEFLHLNPEWQKVIALYTPMAATVVLAAVVARRGIKRGWNTPNVLHNGWILALALLLSVALLFAYNWGKRIRPSTVDKAVLNNARQLAAGADEYFNAHGVTTCALTDLVGPDKYVKALNLVAEEIYPRSYTQGVAITVRGVAGVRTVTYAP